MELYNYNLNYNLRHVCSNGNKQDPVTGIESYPLCDHLRLTYGGCGIEGIWFEPKENP